MNENGFILGLFPFQFLSFPQQEKSSFLGNLQFISLAPRYHDRQTLRGKGYIDLRNML